MALAVMRVRSLFLLLAQRELERLYTVRNARADHVITISPNRTEYRLVLVHFFLTC
jgi:hypothetical protein